MKIIRPIFRALRCFQSIGFYRFFIELFPVLFKNLQQEIFLLSGRYKLYLKISAKFTLVRFQT